MRLSEQNSQAYFAGTGVSYDELMTLDGTIPRDELAQIYRNALAIAGRKDLGLSIGAQLHMSAHGALGIATSSAPNLRTGLGLLTRYGQTRSDFFDMTVSAVSGGMKVIYTETFDLGDLREFITESVLSGLFSAITFFAGVGQFNGWVCFAYPEPGYGHRYGGHFGDDLSFGQAATEVFIPEALLGLPSPTADALMHEEAVALCERQLQELNTGETSSAALSSEDAVSKLLLENPGQIWTLNEVAEKLHMSPRTLIRRLESEGTRFQAIRDEQAKKQVANYLGDPGLSVESIGHLMGFSDVSSFRRSFKRWFGETPSQYIARLRGGEP